MAYELVQQIIKDLKIRRIFLRLFYHDTPLPNKAIRPFEFFAFSEKRKKRLKPVYGRIGELQEGDDAIGVEIFGEVDDVTPEILELLTNNFENIYEYLTETQPLAERVEPKTYIAGDTETQLVSFNRVEPTLVTEVVRGVAGQDGKDGNTGAGISDIGISGDDLVIVLEKPETTGNILTTINAGKVVGGDGATGTAGTAGTAGNTGAGITGITKDDDGKLILILDDVSKTTFNTDIKTGGTGATGKTGGTSEQQELLVQPEQQEPLAQQEGLVKPELVF